MQNSSKSYRKTVLIIGMTPFFGGGEAYILNLIDFLKEKFNIVLLISSKDLIRRIENDVKVFYEPSNSYLLYWKNYFKVLRLIKKYKVDVVIPVSYTHLTLPTILLV